MMAHGHDVWINLPDGVMVVVVVVVVVASGVQDPTQLPYPAFV